MHCFCLFQSNITLSKGSHLLKMHLIFFNFSEYFEQCCSIPWQMYPCHWSIVVLVTSSRHKHNPGQDSLLVPDELHHPLPHQLQLLPCAVSDNMVNTHLNVWMRYQLFVCYLTCKSFLVSPNLFIMLPPAIVISLSSLLFMVTRVITPSRTWNMFGSENKIKQPLNKKSYFKTKWEKEV